MTAAEVAEAMARDVKRVWPDAALELVPMGDGETEVALDPSVAERQLQRSPASSRHRIQRRHPVVGPKVMGSGACLGAS